MSSLPLLRCVQPENPDSVVLLHPFPSAAELRESGVYVEHLFVSRDLRCVRVGGAVYEIPDMISVRFRDGHYLLQPEQAVRLTADLFDALTEQFDGSPAASDPAMRARMERIWAEWHRNGTAHVLVMAGEEAAIP